MASDPLDEGYKAFESALLRGALPQAETVAMHLMAQNSADERAQVAMARVMVAKNRVDDGVARLERYTANRPQAPLALAFLAEFWKGRDEVKAVDYATRSVQGGGRVPAALVVLGDAALKRGDGQGALTWYGGALKLMPNNVEGWKGLANTLRMLKRRAEAAQALENAVAIQPTDTSLWVDLLRTLLDMGDAEWARDKAQAALKAHPRNADIMALANQVRQLGTTTSDPLAREIASTREMLLNGKREEAAAKLQQILKYHRPTRALKFLMAELNAATPGQDATVHLTGVLDLTKSYPEAWEPRALLGELLARRSTVRNVKQAMTHAEEAWNMSGGHPLAGVTVVRVYMAAGKPSLAKALAAQLKVRRPDLAAVLDKALQPA